MAKGYVGIPCNIIKTPHSKINFFKFLKTYNLTDPFFQAIPIPTH